ncbi:MAG: DUF2505 domain-containing protein [Myxococcales bacterium]|nr:DUF2505 domain-containing protein [Myxococcales bacterium]MCB9751968.1 DUF2505 domain-containing protein [Myxococcales bacterium]
MHKYTVEDDFETTVDRYWAVFFDEEYNKGLFEHLAITREVLEITREGEGQDEVIRRRIRLTPQRDVPTIFKRFVKGAIQYTEHNVFTRKKDTIDVKIVPGFMGDKFTSVGTYIVRATGDNKVRRTFHGEINCSVPLVGGRVEKHIAGEVIDGYKKTTDFTRRWLREHPASE